MGSFCLFYFCSYSHSTKFYTLNMMLNTSSKFSTPSSMAWMASALLIALAFLPAVSAECSHGNYFGIGKCCCTCQGKDCEGHLLGNCHDSDSHDEKKCACKTEKLECKTQ